MKLEIYQVNCAGTQFTDKIMKFRKAISPARSSAGNDKLLGKRRPVVVQPNMRSYYFVVLYKHKQLTVKHKLTYIY